MTLSRSRTRIFRGFLQLQARFVIVFSAGAGGRRVTAAGPKVRLHRVFLHAERAGRLSATSHSEQCDEKFDDTKFDAG
jgi:hypothetical protein